ncbi:MAG: VWA domain-containing protein [Candidatus Sulfotelmatobacter sp.]
MMLLSSAIPQETTLRSQSNLVFIPTMVKDGSGIVYGLTAKDFVVEDDGVEQALRLDESPEGQPISLVIAIQNGRRASYEFSRIQRLNSMLEPIVSEGLATVATVEFDSQVHAIHDFTANAELVAQDLQELRPGDGGAAILDAVDYSIKLLEKCPKERQRVLLLISETRDHGSKEAKVDEVVAEIGQSNTVIYALAFSPALSNILDTGRGNNMAEMHNGVDFMDLLYRARQAMRQNVPEAIAAMTGGEYELFTTRKKFEARMIDFTNHLHSRYLLSIEPKNPHPGLHRLRVRLREGGAGAVLARSSYWAQGTAQ